METDVSWRGAGCLDEKLQTIFYFSLTCNHYHSYFQIIFLLFNIGMSSVSFFLT